MIFNLSEQNSIANRFVAELRDVQIQKDRMRFRRNMERLGEVIAYEISKQLRYKEVEVETPLGIAKIQLPDQKLVLATILRAGLPLHQGLLNYFDYADNAFVSAYRKHHKDGTFEIHVEYVSCPSIEDSVLIVIDPMLATGASMSLAVKALQEYGTPQEIHFATAIASSYGLDHVRRLFPESYIWLGALDEELTAKSYIVPGLGDAGDLSYGLKLQE
ncbi:MAG: uracil phosphoribosyltransferase [Saprospiraceae bacterium]|nr:uracil phosphoribosyltransferase [Saprospiraceae bacterium]